MRPAPDEIIAGIRQILKTDVAPLVPSSAQPQLKRVMAVLRDARWSEAGFDLLRENARFAQTASDIVTRMEQAAKLPASIITAVTALRAASDLATKTIPTSFIEANNINRELRSALSLWFDAACDGQVFAFDDLCERVGATLMALRAA